MMGPGAETFEIALTNCDREPIHIPGSVQAHGALVVLREPELTIIQVSANTAEHFGIAPEALIGQPLGTLLAPPDLTYLTERILPKQLDNTPHYLPAMPAGPRGILFEAIMHRTQGLLLIEFEARPELVGAPTVELYAALKHTINILDGATDVRTFCRLAAEQVRHFTGFDRVLIYQFREDDSGHVLAEARRDDLESYLGLHYPAADIPKQARSLYLKSWLRLLHSTEDVPARLVPLLNPFTGAPLDLSYAVIRSMSPIHIEYLRNMGVQASMSISIIKDGALWGLVACHHQTPKYVPHDTRSICEFLAHMLSLQLGAKQNAEEQAYRARLNAQHAQFVEQMTSAPAYQHGLTRSEPNLLGWIDADGVAVCNQAELELLGRTPDATQVQRLIDWLAQHMDGPLYATNALGTSYPAAQAWGAVASGLLALRVSQHTRSYILWFRSEYRHQVSWAGDPTKPVVAGPSGDRLTPRSSFALWQQEVAGTSLPWKDCEREAAVQLRRSILEIVLRHAEELTRLNAELERSNVDLDSFAYIAAHDLKEPLRGIHNYAYFLLEDYTDKLADAGVDQLTTLIRLTQRMEALLDALLHYSRVGRAELERSDIDLNAEVADVVTLLGARIAERGVEIRIPRPLPTMYADHVRVGEIFTNLLTNAIKYNDKAAKWIEIGYEPIVLRVNERLTASYRLYVRDNGIGIPAQHQSIIFQIFKRLHSREEYGGGVGVGLTIVKKIIERHGGMLWVDSQPAVGTTISFTLAEGVIDQALPSGGAQSTHEVQP